MPKVLDHEAYFWTKVTTTGFCWLWAGAVNGSGYGSIGRNGKKRIAHRESYQYLVGEIPGGFELDHLCRERLCVNPDHLEPVLKRDNILRGYGTGAIFARRENCPKCGGTDFAARSDGGRRCKPCTNARSRRVRDEVRGGSSRNKHQRAILDPQ